MRIGALEAGGTKMVLGIFDGEGAELERLSIPTEAPEVTMPAMVDFFSSRDIDALGVGSFGPLDLDGRSPTYGCITSTPKLKWRGYPLLDKLLNGRDIPAAIDTDVNAAALAELELGAARGLMSAVYITVGTGIGGGVCVRGEPVHGLVHPEVGHMLLRPRPDDPIPRGVCPYHDGCLEGLASGPAIAARAGVDARTLPDDHIVFDIEAHYLAQLCVNLIMTLSPQRILLGGGVMGREGLLPKIREETLRLLGGYVQAREITERIDEYIAAPALFPVSGLVGAYLLGKRALEEARASRPTA